MPLISVVTAILLLSVACSVSGLVVLTPLLAALALWMITDPELEAHTGSLGALVRRMKERAQSYWTPAIAALGSLARTGRARLPVWIAWLARSAPFLQARALLADMATRAHGPR